MEVIMYQKLLKTTFKRNAYKKHVDSVAYIVYIRWCPCCIPLPIFLYKKIQCFIVLDLIFYALYIFKCFGKTKTQNLHRNFYTQF